MEETQSISYRALNDGSSRVIEWHFERALAKSDEQVAYFYCSNKKDKKPTTSKTITTAATVTTSMTVIKSFLRQLSWSADSREIESSIRAKWTRQKRRSDEIDDADVKTFLVQIIGRCRRTTFIIDAHDECENRGQLVRDLHEIAINGGKNRVNIFITSRERFFAPPDFHRPSLCTITPNMVSEDERLHQEAFEATGSAASIWSASRHRKPGHKCPGS